MEPLLRPSGEEIKKFFKETTTPAFLKKISTEVENTSKQVNVNRRNKEVPSKRRGKSASFMEKLHALIGNKHLEGCVNAEGPCLLALVETYMNHSNYKIMIDGVAKLLPALFSAINALAVHFSRFNRAIQIKFGDDSDEASYAKQHLHLSQEASLLRKKNYAEKIFKQHEHLKQITDTEVLEKINTLRYKDTWPELCVCAGLAIGSRLIEIVYVSEYKEAENPIYVTVTGIAKDKHDREFDPEEDKTARKVTKPILGGILSRELIKIVETIRTQISAQFDVDLGLPDQKGRRELSRKQITNLVDAKVNKVVKDVFDPSYVFHDLRSLYAQLSFVQFAPNNVSQQYYFSHVLGHQESSLTTALSYSKFAIRRKLDENDPDMRAEIVTLKEEFKGLQHAVLEEKKIGSIYHGKRKLPSDLEDSALENTAVSFMKPDGTILTMQKQPHLRNNDEKSRMARLEQSAKTLQDNHIKPTSRNLLRLGFGSRIVNLYKKQKKDKAEEVRPPNPQPEAEKKSDLENQRLQQLEITGDEL
jgi:hypothetical protein